MPADAINYGFVARELNKILTNGRIDKITINDKSEILLLIRANNENRMLLITTATAPRCYLSTTKITPTDVPTSFCLHLRRHIGGGIINKVEEVPFERVIRFFITSRDDFGGEIKRILVVELMGKYSNVVLTDGDYKITDALKHISLSESRPIVPGLTYSLPVDETKFNPDSKEADNVFATCDGDEAVLMKRLRGLSPITLREIIAIATTRGITLSEAYSSFVQEFSPVVYYNSDVPVDFSFRKYTTVNLPSKPFETLSKAMDAYYLPQEKAKERADAESGVKRVLNAALEKQRKKLGSFIHDIEQARDFDKERIVGELITANLYKIKKSDASVTVDNWYDGTQQTIKLTENSPQADAQKHFKRYQKKKRTVDIINGQIEETKSLIEYLESVDASLSVATSISDINDIAEELTEYGLIKRQNSKKKLAVSAPRQYTEDGFTILVGKSNLQNDKITKEARGEDIWLHTQGIHGSHVVIKAMGKVVPRSVIERAAVYAAFFSKGRLSDKVPVDYTKAKNVHKQRGAAPGKVDYFDAKTIYVKPAPPIDSEK